MAIRIPKNQTVESKYTSGKEYMFASTQNEYKGYYYEVKGKVFAGEKFNPGDPEIVKIKSDNYNMLLGKASTYLYGLVSKVKLPNSKPVSSSIFQKKDPNERYVNRYFTQKVNQTSLIKEINEESFNNTKKNPLYNSVAIKWDTTSSNEAAIDQAEKQIPGIKEFLKDLNFNPASDIDDYEIGGNSKDV
jgi:hypothetical protein